MNALLSTGQSLPAKNYSSGNTCAKCSSRMRCLPYGLDERWPSPIVTDTPARRILNFQTESG